jgi:predicted DNA-binding transcriptional regulator YafY
MIEGALAKIERVLPEALRARLQAVQASIEFQPAQNPPQPPGELLLLVSGAVHQQRRIQIRYQSQRQETQREVDPYGIVTHWDRWYMVGWCHLRQDVRVFRLDRMLGATLADEVFTRPDGFDSLRYVLDSLAGAPWGWSVEVLLEISMEDARQRIPPGNALLEQEDGGVVLRTHIDRLDWMARMLLMLGISFIIRKPDELRVALRAVAAEAAALAERREEGA